jgi:hypothetical protein
MARLRRQIEHPAKKKTTIAATTALVCTIRALLLFAYGGLRLSSPKVPVIPKDDVEKARGWNGRAVYWRCVHVVAAPARAALFRRRTTEILQFHFTMLERKVLFRVGSHKFLVTCFSRPLFIITTIFN